jgi:hypothetical protein
MLIVDNLPYLAGVRRAAFLLADIPLSAIQVLLEEVELVLGVGEAALQVGGLDARLLHLPLQTRV